MEWRRGGGVIQFTDTGPLQWGTTEAKAGTLSSVVTDGVVDTPQSYLFYFEKNNVFFPKGPGEPLTSTKKNKTKLYKKNEAQPQKKTLTGASLVSVFKRGGESCSQEECLLLGADAGVRRTGGRCDKL